MPCDPASLAHKHASYGNSFASVNATKYREGNVPKPFLVYFFGATARMENQVQVLVFGKFKDHHAVITDIHRVQVLSSPF